MSTASKYVVFGNLLCGGVRADEGDQFFNLGKNSDDVDVLDTEKFQNHLNGLEKWFFGGSTKVAGFTQSKSSGRVNEDCAIVTKNHLELHGYEITIDAVFDGHGSNTYSEAAAEELPKEVFRKLTSWESEKCCFEPLFWNRNATDWKEFFHEIFKTFNKRHNVALRMTSFQKLRQLARNWFTLCSESEDEVPTGTTATIVLTITNNRFVRFDQKAVRVITANLGDSPANLIVVPKENTGNSKAYPLTVDHDLWNNKAELQKAVENGSEVRISTYDNNDGFCRIGKDSSNKYYVKHGWATIDESKSNLTAEEIMDQRTIWNTSADALRYLEEEKLTLQMKRRLRSGSASDVKEEIERDGLGWKKFQAFAYVDRGSMTRSLGDFHRKGKQGKPDVSVVKLKPAFFEENKAMLLLGSDGLLKSFGKQALYEKKESAPAEVTSILEIDRTTKESASFQTLICDKGPSNEHFKSPKALVQELTKHIARQAKTCYKPHDDESGPTPMLLLDDIAVIVRDLE